MTNRVKGAVAAVAVAIGIWCVGTAEAGNASIPSALYFSVKLLPDQYLFYGGTNMDAVMLIDDVTYSADLDRCEPPEQCAYFSEDLEGPPPDPGGYAIPDLSDYGKVFTYARGAHHYLVLEEEDPQTQTVQEFDRFSHSAHAEMFLLYDEITVDKDDTEIFPNPVGSFKGPSSAVPPGLRSANRTRSQVHSPSAPPQLEVKGTTGFGLMGWATPTSGSRHYQSPQIVQSSGRVWLRDKGHPYKSAVCYIKGRVIPDPNDAPGEPMPPTEGVGVGEPQ